MIRIIFTILFTIIYISVFSQRKVTGRVIDYFTRQPLAYASIICDSKSLTADVEGYFSFVANNEVLVSVTHIGYENITVPVNENLAIITMKPKDIHLKDIVLNTNNTALKFSSIAKVDVNAKPIKNAQELLRVVPGLFVAQHAGGGKAEQIFLRGFDCDHGTDVQLSVDGMPVNMVSHAHGQGYADAHFIIPETIDNVDYGTGPYYAQQGNFNTAGYVNFSTYKRINKSMVQIEAGNYNTYRALAMMDLKLKNKDKQSAYIASEFNYSNGPTLNPQNFNRFNIFGKYNYAISNTMFLTFSSSAFKSKWNASGQIPERAVQNGIIDRFGSIDPTEGGNTERYNVNANFTVKFNNGMLLHNQMYFTKYSFDLYSNFTFFLNDSINGDGINQKENRNVYGYNTTLSQKIFINNSVLQSTYGAGFRHDVNNDVQLSRSPKRMFLEYLNKGNINETNGYAYMNHQLTVGKWLIDAGLRFDNFYFNYSDHIYTKSLPSQTKGIFSPKFNILYQFNKNIQLYVKAGKGFHSNDARVVVANEGREILPAAYGSDVGVMIKPVKNLLINIAAWYLHLNQEFIYVGDEGIVEPGGKTKRDGIDIITRYQFKDNFYATLNLNFTRAQTINEPKGQNYIPLAPTLTSTGGLFYKKRLGFNGGVNYRFIKDRSANEDNSIIAKGYLICDGIVNYTQPKYEIGLSVENVFNTRWNEAQFATESRLQNETSSVTELHFTPGTPLAFRLRMALFF